MENIAAKVLQLAEKYRDHTAQNLSRLVRIKSLTGQEGEVAAELKKQMEDAGFDDVRSDGLGNVLGRVGKGKRLLAVDAHIDTVDQGNLENWSEPPFSGRIADGFVHGRGSVDQKGGAAAMVTAGRILAELGLENDLSVLFTGTVMEEDCDGLCWKYIIEEEKIRPELVIITEPTALGIYRGQRGRMEIRVSFKGLSAHGSAPERGKNAIYMGARACLEIEKLNERLAADDFLGKGSVTVSEFVSGSPSLCAVADSARIHLDRRLTAGETKESALAEVREAGQGRGRRARGAAVQGKIVYRPGIRHGKILPDLDGRRRPPGRDPGRGCVPLPFPERAARGQVDLLHQRRDHQRHPRHPDHRLRPRRRGLRPRAEREDPGRRPGQGVGVLRAVRVEHEIGTRLKV